MEHEERPKAALADRYTIEREIGSGEMASVYLAQDVKHDRKVAEKVLKPELAAVMGTERFLAEIRTTANLSHPLAATHSSRARRIEPGPTANGAAEDSQTPCKFTDSRQVGFWNRTGTAPPARRDGD